MSYVDVSSVEPLQDYHVLIKFKDGTARELDVKPWIRGNWYSKLADIEYFKKVRPHELRGAIEWPDGQDIAPEDILEFGKKIDIEVIPQYLIPA